MVANGMWLMVRLIHKMCSADCWSVPHIVHAVIAGISLAVFSIMGGELVQCMLGLL